jgi:SAM-dependent methyltransferase
MSATIDEARLEAFMERMLGDMGAAITAPLMLIGERLGLFRAMAYAGPLTPADLAERAGVAERYTREWLAALAASDYVSYDPETERFGLPDEHALAFADEDSPAYLMGAYQLLAAVFADEERLAERFRTGAGFGWHEHDPRLFAGTERFFRPGYRAHLVAEWIPAFDGLEDRLREGAEVADVGCGHGASTILMAEAFPASRFTGFDYHEASIRRAREVARAAGVSDRATFEIAGAQEFPGGPYDLVCHFDCLHDMGDPVSAARHVHDSLHSDGWWMIVEPNAHDRLEDNLNPVGRMFYAASTMICTPSSLSQEVGLALGAQAGEARLRAIAEAAGFASFRRAAETPFNLVLEGRP